MHELVRHNVGPFSFQESATPQKTVAVVKFAEGFLCQQRLEPKLERERSHSKLMHNVQVRGSRTNQACTTLYNLFQDNAMTFPFYHRKKHAVNLQECT